MKIEPKNLMTTAQIADYANMPASTAFVLVNSRHFPLPAIMQGRVRLWSKADVVQFFKDHPRAERGKRK